MITLGTGIGCGMFHDGVLVPNTELGHIEIDGKDAETMAADSVRERKDLSWKDYAAHVETYIRRLDALLWPDLVILGGGASKKADKLLPQLDVRPEVVPAALLNEAGIVGAAIAAVGGDTRDAMPFSRPAPTPASGSPRSSSSRVRAIGRSDRFDRRTRPTRRARRGRRGREGRDRAARRHRRRCV